jgi:predicted glycosyltransferase
VDAKRQAIWIDLDNSPHVPLFAPIIKHYRDRGIEVVLTARDHAQTIELLKLAGLDGTFTVIGHHYGKGKLNKVRGMVVRALQLVKHIRRVAAGNVRIAASISHGSRSMVLAARWLGIPAVTMYDYEFTETSIFNRFSRIVMVPERIPDSVLDGIGLPAAKRVKYPGIKEELYVRHFAPDPDFREHFLRDEGRVDMDDRVIVVVRPPAPTANYHSKQSDALLEAVLSNQLGRSDVFTVIVPRTVQQGNEIQETIHTSYCGAKNYLILDNAVNGLDLAFASDLLISGGGTMNREAALLGVPVYSIFAGRQGALDAQMEAEGLITFIRDEEDVEKIVFRRRDSSMPFSNSLTDRVERFVIEQLDSYLDAP